MKKILIKPDEMAVSAEPAVLESLAVGSSIVVCLFDEKKRIGGMVHTLFPIRVAKESVANDHLKYVDTAIKVLYQEIVRLGAVPGNIKAKLAGGARIFCFGGQGKQPDVGKDNVSCARKQLQELGVPILSEDTGENHGRSVHFYVYDGKMEIETVNCARYWI